MGSDLFTHTKMAKAVKTSPVCHMLNGRSQRIVRPEGGGGNKLCWGNCLLLIAHIAHQLGENCPKIVSEECFKKRNSCPDNHNVLLKDAKEKNKV